MRVTYLSAFVASAVGMLALPLAFGQPPYAGYGNAPYGDSPQPRVVDQGYATARPAQADPGGSGYQSMSPDSWGSSAPAGPSSPPTYASQNPAGQRSFGPSNEYVGAPFKYPLPPSLQSPSSGQLQAGVYGSSPVAPAQALPNSPTVPNYERTDAPSIERMFGLQRQTPVQSPRSPYNNSFQPADFNKKDPRDIPLAPTVPAEIVDSNASELKLSGPDTPGSTDEQPRAIGLGAQNVPTEVQGDLSPPQADAPSTGESNPANAFPVDGDPGDNPSVTQTPYAPFAPVAPSILVSPESNETTLAQPTFAQPTTLHPASAQPLGPALTPYEMPGVFNSAPSAPIPAHAPAQARGEGGFGWGNAPGLFGRAKAKRQQQPPTYRQQEPVEPPHRALHRRQPESPRRATPRIPVPFGIGSQQDQTNQPPQTLPRGNATGVPANTHYQTGGSRLPHLPPQGQGGANAGQPYPMMQPNDQFRPDLGQRAPMPTVRHFGTYDSGRDEYDFENKKKDYPPFNEILATGRWFGSVEAQLLTPRFNGGTDLRVTDNSTVGRPITTALPFDYDSELAPNLRFGFESKYGPGFEVDYRQLNAGSDVSQFTSIGNAGSSLEFPVTGSTGALELTAFNVGETLTAQHSMKLETFAFSVFKEVQLPITRINGLFGFQFANIEHRTSGVVESGGAVLRTGQSSSDMRAFGPRLRIEYYRQLGHTPVEFITAFGGSLMFGRSDQLISLSDGGSFERRDSDESVSTLDFLTGVQIRKRLNENESVFARVGFINQYFSGGGSAGLPEDNFGLRGFSFLVGVNR